MDITAILLSAVIIMYTLSAPRGRNRYHPLGYGALLAVLAVAYARINSEPIYYALAALALAKGIYSYMRWRR